MNTLLQPLIGIIIEYGIDELDIIEYVLNEFPEVAEKSLPIALHNTFSHCETAKRLSTGALADHFYILWYLAPKSLWKDDVREILKRNPYHLVKYLVAKWEECLAYKIDFLDICDTAASFGATETLIALASTFPDKFTDVEKVDALCAAAGSNHLSTVEWLLSVNANPNSRDSYSSANALMHAAEMFHVEAVKLLMQHGGECSDEVISRCTSGVSTGMCFTKNPHVEGCVRITMVLLNLDVKIEMARSIFSTIVSVNKFPYPDNILCEAVKFATGHGYYDVAMLLSTCT